MKSPLPPGVLRDPVNLFSLGFGLGAVPWAPGTFGTLLGIPLYLLLKDLSWWVYGDAILLIFVLGAFAAEYTARVLGVHDHGAIVIDEVVGYLVAMIAAPAGWGWIIAGFVLFRVFDIWKPWPIGWLDRRVHGGFGIMLDDVVAGAYALLVMQIASRIF
ncbi:MAG: phosphatidylglycerophosphatase A [Chromatiales bacterium]|jgi:phosphatidylglycerophosphatase A|nr:phosphatidylglycerophosphatase A [Chromatiales bacterium]